MSFTIPGIMPSPVFDKYFEQGDDLVKVEDPIQFELGSYKELEKFVNSYGDVYHRYKDKLGFVKWVSLSAIQEQVNIVGREEALKVAFYDAESKFIPEGYGEEEF